MVKYRQLHTKILDSFDFNEMPNDFVRVCWTLLPLILDGEGRGIFSMSWIKSKMYPMRDDVTIDQLKKAFEWIKERKMIVVYTICGHQYFYIPTWKEHQSGTQKEAKSSLPSPELLQTISGVAPELPEVPASASESANESESELIDPIIKITEMYTNEIGPITAFIKDMLIEASNDYPITWFESAFKEAVKHQARNWKYVEAILKRYKAEGFNPDSKPKKKLNGDTTQDIIARAQERYGMNGDNS
jgi:DnaD/phage-associated family protein